MAQYNANIQVTADFNAAEKALRDFETRFNKLAGGLDITKQVGRSFTEAFVPPKQLKQIDRELATIASRADTVAKRFARVVEGAGTLGVAAKGISDVGQVLENLSVSAQTVAANFNNANLATKVLVPGFNLAKETANNLAKSVSLLEYKFHALVPSADGITQALAAIGPEAGLAAGAIAAIGTAMETVLRGRAQELDKDLTATLRQINDQTQALFRTLESLGQRVGGTARQFQNLLRAGEERLANVSAYSEEARRAMSTILTAEMRLTAELERQAALRREMQTSRFAAVASRTGMGFDFSQQRMLPAAGQTSFLGEVRGGIGGGARNPLSNYEMLIGASGRLAARTQDNVDQALRWAQATKEQVRLVSQIDYIMPGILAKSISLSRIKALPDSDMLQASARGLRTIETIEQGRIDRLERIRQKLQQIQQYVSEDEKGVPFPNLENFGGVQPTTGPFQARFGKQGPAVPPVGLKSGGTGLGGFLQKPGVADAMMGAGFPMLFGAGPGAIAGGGIGGFIGGAMGGPLGMALGIALSAVGQNLDEAVKRIADIGNALKTLNMDSLRDSAIAVNTELDRTTTLLIRAGNFDAARAEVAKQITLQTGLLPESVTASTQATTALSTAWNEVVASVSGTVSILSTPFISALTVILQGLAKATQGINVILQVIQQYALVLNPIAQLFLKIAALLPQINEEQEKLTAELYTTTENLNRELALNSKILDLEKTRTLGRTVAEQAYNAAVESRIKKEQINAEYQVKIEEQRQKFAGVRTAEGRKELKLHIEQLEARKQQLLNEVDIKNALEAQRFELDLIKEAYRIIALDSEKQAVAADTQLKLGQLSGSIREDQVGILKLQQEQLAVAEQLVNKEAELSALQRTRAGLTPEQTKQFELEIAKLQNKKVDLQVQVNKESLKKIEEDINRAAKAATHSIDMQVVAARGQQTIQQSQYDLMRSMNDLQLQRIGFEEQLLNNAFEQTTNFSEQLAILDRLAELVQYRYELNVANANVERLSTIAQIKANTELLALEVQRQRIQYFRIVAAVKEQQAMGVYNNQQQEAIAAQSSALDIAVSTYDYAVRNAVVQERIANAVYDQKVEAAGFARNMELASLASRRAGLNGGDNREAGMGLGQRFVMGRTYQGGSFEVSNSSLKKMAKGGYVTSPTMALIGEGGEPEFVVPQSKAMAFAENWMNGRRGADALPRLATVSSSPQPTINITTGPVMQQNGTTYVTLADMEQAMQTMASNMLGSNRSYSGRRYQGVS